ncbi:PqqD family protein [Actinomyces slackii]|uniref:Zn-dependent proteases n=1 Tax=Actinomyces slackii TaxID=52774 RepID=A0A448KAB8_9ACTO|nr:PqqD family protein [Actinomyces slackii]VEG73867.1 Zn-dependent proteases [Actinomyces slackii]
MSTTSDIPRLRPGVTLIVGMDNQAMLFDSASGSYHRLGAAAAFIVNQFDGLRSLSTIIDQLPQDIDDAGVQRITGMVEALRSKRLLVGPGPERAVGPPPSPAKVRRARRVRGRHVAYPRMGRHLQVSSPRWSGGWMLPRLMVMRSFNRVVAPLAALLHRLPARALSWVFLAASVAGFVAGAVALINLAGGPPPGMHVFVIAVAIQLVSIVAHESWHAIVAAWLGTPVRGLGVAFMFWVLPIAYVDRTDSYRVRSRLGRAMLALAGICSDGVICGIEAAVAASSTGTVRHVALTLCAFQLTMLITNLSPLTQSDGVAAAEALTGTVNLRGRSMLILGSVLRREPLPAGLASLRPAVRWGYFAYGLACTLLGAATMVVSVVWMGFLATYLVKGLLA